MSTSGIFQLVTNDGKQDRLLLATELLNSHLKKVRAERIAAGSTDPTPTLSDIRTYHVNFLESFFKPFVAIGFEYNKVKCAQGNVRLGGDLRFSIPQFGDFFNDMVVHIRLSGLKADVFPDKVKYAEFLGHRLFEKTTFEVNNNILDTYDSDSYNFYYQFRLFTNKLAGWRRDVGQENLVYGYHTADPINDEFREYKLIGHGPQTLKFEHPVVDMWIPLLFWFNLDSKLSIPSVAIPYGQRFINIKLAPESDLVASVDYGGGGSYQSPKIDFAELYINNIFVNPEIHDIYIRRIGFSLVRVRRIQTKLLDTRVGRVALGEMKFPIETMFFCFKPVENLTNVDYWHKCGKVNVQPISLPGVRPKQPIRGCEPPTDPVVPIPLPVEVVVTDGLYLCEQPTVRTIGLSAHGVPLYENIPERFFNSYVPWRFGMGINTPFDPYAYMITFALHPDQYQPSGYINVSRAREFYMEYTSDLIDSNFHVQLKVESTAINFLLVSDGSAILRYAT